MIWLGLIVSLAYIPGYTGVLLPTQWAVLSMVLPLALWRIGTFGVLHWLGAGFLCYAFLSLLFLSDQFDAIYRLWHLCILALAFWLGSTLSSLRQVYIGLAIGLSLSSAVAVIQFLGYQPVLQGSGYPGLLANKMIHGEALAIVIVALLSERLWWYIPALVPGLILANSRGAYLALVISAILVFFKRPLIALIVGLVGLWFYTAVTRDSDIDRLQIWSAAIAGLTPFGNGPGSFLSVYFSSQTKVTQLEYVHNDFLQLAFEFGIGAVFAFAIYALVLSRSAAREWPIFVAFALMGLFSFPLFAPITAFLGTLVAGRIASDWNLSRRGFDHGRSSLVQRYAGQ